MKFRSLTVVTILTALALQLAACGGSRYRPDSPDVRYLSSREYEKLQLPPDVAGTGEQQFVIPRNSVKISRGSILPGVDSARFQREGDQSWLELKVPVERLWTELVAFLENEGLALAENDSVAGFLLTEWKQPVEREERDGILQTVLGDKKRVTEDQVLRYALRLERSTADSSRLFVRTSQYRKYEAEQGSNSQGWNLVDDDPEASANLLARILVWIGLDEQESRELISSTDIKEFKARILLTANKDERHYILFWDNYEHVFARVQTALDAAGFETTDSELDEGLIEIRSPEDALLEVSQAQLKRRQDNAGFFKRRFGSDEIRGADLTLRFHRVESRIFAVDVVEPDTGEITASAGRQVLESIRDAIING